MPPDAKLDGGGALPQACDHDHDLLEEPHHHPPPHAAGGDGGRSRWQSLDWAYPKSRKPGIMASVDTWLEDRRKMDGAEGLWRVDGNLYDLTPFIEAHPGGSEWLELTKGTDITEAFYSHHISEAAERLLPKFLVRPASAPRNSPFTFHADGFYMQLRERARKVLADTPEQVLVHARQRSRNIVDSLAVSTLLACALAAHLNSLVVGAVAGVLLALTAGGAHNFFHQRHNWRRYYFELGFMSSREWMVSHALSHHIFPNTIQDLEVTFFEPIMSFLPYPNKPLVVRYLSWVYCIAVYASVGHGQFAKRLAHLRWSDAVSLAVPASMLLTGATLWDTWIMWTWVLVVSSFYFAYQGLSAGHHHPDNYHEGDAVSQDHDYGLMQLATTASCSGMRGRESLFLCLTHFGDHRLHHFFPSLDHAILPLLEPTLAEHLAQYHIPHLRLSAWEALKGKYLQLARNRPNPRPPGGQFQ